jgi:hypothetical protein
MMSLTINQIKFLEKQLILWAGGPLKSELPLEFARLLLGLTEADLPFYDSRGNKDFQHNPLYWSGGITKPIINQWITSQINGNRQVPPMWPHGKKFAVCLTHDVDFISPHSVIGQSRFLNLLWKRWKRNEDQVWFFLRGLARMAYCGLLRSGRTVPFEPWLEAEDKFGFRSTFFFFPDRASCYHPRDHMYYRHHDKLFFEGSQITVAELFQKLDHDGWEVGLHGTFESFDKSRELESQKQQIEESLGKKIVSIRQHCLHFDIKKTPIAQHRAGFKYDSTFGFNRIIGFRNGLALPIYHYDFENDKPLPILQIPLHIQDNALFRIEDLDLTPELALIRVMQLMDKVEEVNGLITLLWHPRINNDNGASIWLKIYQDILKYIAFKDAWVAPVREIGMWWEYRSQLI